MLQWSLTRLGQGQGVIEMGKEVKPDLELGQQLIRGEKESAREQVLVCHTRPAFKRQHLELLAVGGETREQ